MVKATLKRSLGLFEVTAAGVGIILGAGIYALVGKAAALSGNGVWLSFLISAIIAALTGLSYAELSSLFPKAGAEYVYTNKAFGKGWAFLIGWLVTIGGIIGAATVSLGFGGYLSALTGIPVLYGALLLIALVLLILFYGVKESAQAAIIGTIVEAGGLLIIILIGLPYLGSVDYFDIPDFSGVLSGAALVFFAYLGFEEMSRMAEEVKDPQKTMPKALVLAIIISSILYILVSLSAISIFSPEELGNSTAPLADVASKAFGSDLYVILAIAALFATANTVLMMQFATSRIIYGMAGSSLLAYINPSKRTPWLAILAATIGTVLFTMIGKIESIAYLTDFTIFSAFIAVNCALIWLRKKEPNLKRPFKVPTLLIPALGAISSFAMLFAMPLEIVVYGLGVVGMGVIVYLSIVRGKD